MLDNGVYNVSHFQSFHFSSVAVWELTVFSPESYALDFLKLSLPPAFPSNYQAKFWLNLKILVTDGVQTRKIKLSV